MKKFLKFYKQLLGLFFQNFDKIKKPKIEEKQKN